MAPPPRINQTWLPSQTGPIVLMMMRRSTSVLPTTGMRMSTPRSNPSIAAKAISNTPSSTHQMMRRVS